MAARGGHWFKGFFRPNPTRQQFIRDLARLGPDDKEQAAAFRPDDRMLWKKEGDFDQVPLTQQEADQARNAHVVHNHPRGGSLSGRDLGMAIRRNVASSAVVPAGSRVAHQITRPPGGWRDRQGRPLDGDAVELQAERQFTRLYLRGLRRARQPVSKQEERRIEAVASERAVRVVARAYGIPYDVKPIP